MPCEIMMSVPVRLCMGLLHKALVDQWPETGGSAILPLSPRGNWHRDALPRKGPFGRGRGQSTSAVYFFLCIAR